MNETGVGAKAEKIGTEGEAEAEVDSKKVSITEDGKKPQKYTEEGFLPNNPLVFVDTTGDNRYRETEDSPDEQSSTSGNKMLA